MRVRLYLREDLSSISAMLRGGGGTGKIMKILIVHNPYQQPGGEDVVFQQERNMLQRAGHEVITFSRDNDEINEYVGLRRLALVKQTIWATDSRREFVRLLAREKPQIVHVHNTFIMISPSIFSACVDAGIPVVHTLHNYRLFCPAGVFYRDGHVCEDCVKHGLWQGVRHGCYRSSTKATATVALMLAVHRKLNTWMHPSHFYIALTEFARQKFLDGGLPSDRIFVKPNFTDPDPGFSPAKEDYAVFIGRLSPEKRVSTVLSAWGRLGSGLQLRIVGGGPERSTLERSALQERLQNVHFMGHVPHEQVLAILAKARFLIFSSEWYENFPVTIVEAFACGTPVICSRLGAIREIVADGRTGMHFNPGDPEDLAEKVKWACDHTESLCGMGEAARREYETKYTPEINYSLLMDIYRQVLARPLSSDRQVA